MNSTSYNKKKWMGIYAILGVLFLTIHYLLALDYFNEWKDYVPGFRVLCMTLFLIMEIMAIGKLIELIIISRNETLGVRYNLLRITRLLTYILVIIVVVSFVLQSLYAAAGTIGLASLILGFALQAPISSFIAWLYIVFRRPYQVGDRIRLDSFKGDVIEITYLDTIILECSGEYLGNDRRSGRKIHFPNSVVLKSEVINYSGPFVPFIWNETPIQVAYTSDIDFVEECLLEAAIEDFKEQYPEYDIDKMKQWQPAVYFRVSPYAWIEAVVSYPVEPNDTTGRRNRILKIVLPRLQEHPDKVQFPEGTSR